MIHLIHCSKSTYTANWWQRTDFWIRVEVAQGMYCSSNSCTASSIWSFSLDFLEPSTLQLHLQEYTESRLGNVILPLAVFGCFKRHVTEILIRSHHRMHRARASNSVKPESNDLSSLRPSHIIFLLAAHRHECSEHFVYHISLGARCFWLRLPLYTFVVSLMITLFPV